MALLTEVTQKLGVKDTDDPISHEKPFAIGNRLWKYNPNKHRALAAAMRYGWSEPVYNHIFYHLAGAPLASFIEYTGAVESTQAATGLVFKSGTGNRVAAGSRAFFPAINEIIRFTADFASTTTSAAVARNFGLGNSTTSLLKPGMKGILLTPAMIQGFTTGNGITNNKVLKTFACTETSNPVQMTNVEAAERTRVGDPWKNAVGDTWDLTKTERENELLFGAYVSDNSTYTHPISAAQGIDSFISTNVYSAAYLSRMDFIDILTETKQLAEGLTIDLWYSYAFSALMAEWAQEITTITVPITGQMKTEMGQLGLEINKIRIGGATFEGHEINVLGQEEYLMGKVYGVPRGRIGYRPLIYHENLDIRYRPIMRDEVHSKEGEFYGVTGWEYGEEERWFKIEDLLFAA